MVVSHRFVYSILVMLQLCRRSFMQEMLNKMVASVRHGVLGPDDASRAIHECAAMLNLQLASDLPINTVIVTGLRKTASAANVTDAFREFGEIEDAAVASCKRGFGTLSSQFLQGLGSVYLPHALLQCVFQALFALSPRNL